MKNMTNILLLEDDPILGEGLLLNLQMAGYQVEWCKTVRDGLLACEKPFDLALLDLTLPDGSGFEVCQKIRTLDMGRPVLMLTARSDEDSVVKGFESGANDYIRKPFGNRELLARIRNALPTGDATDGWRYGKAFLAKGQRLLQVEGRDVPLNRREYEILSCLFQNQDRIVSRERLITEIDKDGEIFDRTIDSHVSHIRNKLRKAGVETVRIESVYGEGYRLGGA